MLSHPESRDRRHTTHDGDLPFSTKFDRGSARTGFSGMDRLSRKLEKDALKWVSATTPLHFDRTEKNRLHAGLPRSDIKGRSSHSTEDTVTSPGSGFACRNTMKSAANLTADGSALSRSSGSNWASAASDDFYHLTEKYIHGTALTANLRSHESPAAAAAAAVAATSSSENNKSADHILEGTRCSDDGSRQNNNINDDLVNRGTKDNEIGGSRGSSGEGVDVSPSGAPPSPTDKKSPIRAEDDEEDDAPRAKKAQKQEHEAREKADKGGDKEIDWVKAWDLLRRDNHCAIPGTEWKLLKESFLCLLKQNADKEEENVNMRGHVERILQASVDQLGLLEQKVTKQVSEWRKEMVKFLAAKDNQIESLRVREVEASRQIYQLSAQLSTINHSKRRTSSPGPHAHAKTSPRPSGHSQIANQHQQSRQGVGLEYNSNSPSPGSSRLKPPENHDHHLRHRATTHLSYSSHHNLLHLAPSLASPYYGLPYDGAAHTSSSPAHHQHYSDPLHLAHHHLSRTSPQITSAPYLGEGTLDMPRSPPRASILSSPAHSLRRPQALAQAQPHHDEIHQSYHASSPSAGLRPATSPSSGSSPKPFLAAGGGKTSSGRHRPTLHGKHNTSSGGKNPHHPHHHHGPSSSSEQNIGGSGAEIHHGGYINNHPHGSSGARSMSSGAVKKNEYRSSYDTGNNTRGSTDGRDRKGRGDGVGHGSHGLEGRRHGASSSSQRRRFEYDEALRKSREQDKKKEKGCGLVVTGAAGSGGGRGGEVVAYPSGSISRPPSMPPPTMIQGHNTSHVINAGGGFLTTTPLACSFSPTALCGAYNVHNAQRLQEGAQGQGQGQGVFKTYVMSSPTLGRRQEMEQQQQNTTNTLPSSPVDSTRLGNPLASARTYASGYTSLHSARTQVAYGPPPTGTGTGMSTAAGSPTRSFLKGPEYNREEDTFGSKWRPLSVDAPALKERKATDRCTHSSNRVAVAEAGAGAGSSSAAARAHTVSPPRTMHITQIGSTLCPPCNITRSPLITPRTVNIGVFPCWNTTPKLHSREINISSPFLPTTNTQSPPSNTTPTVTHGNGNTGEEHGTHGNAALTSNGNGTNGHGPTMSPHDNHHTTHTTHGKGGSATVTVGGNVMSNTVAAHGNPGLGQHVAHGNRIALGMPNASRAHAGGPPRTNNNRPGGSYIGSRSASTGRLQL